MAKVTKLGKYRLVALLVFAHSSFLSPFHSSVANSAPATTTAPTPAATAASISTPATSSDELGDCNWLVTYRGRTYDLAPLTREALARPIETDLRYALQRVPEAEDHLNKMSAKLKEARMHTVLASVFISGLVVSRILQSREKNSDRRRDYDPISFATGGFFLGATFFSWKATRDAKRELVNAVNAFNEVSPHKIEPSTPERRNVMVP